VSAASGKLARVLSACTIALVLALCVNPFVVLASPLTFSMIGDLDVDGQVGILDLALLSSEYLKTSVHTEWQSEFDLNGDLIIDLYDFVVISKWMGCPGAPQQVSAQPGDRHVVVSFVPPQSDGGHTITGYTVRVYREAVLEAHLGTTEASASRMGWRILSE